MKGSRARTARGTITVVQEERFRLVTDDGQGLLLTCRSGLDGRDLCRWHANQTHLVVEYEGEPNLVSGVARSIRPIT